MNEKRHGFTLVELLVVMAIITLLASMLLPTLTKAMESARSMACLNNLKQIGLGYGLYDDNWRAIPPACAFNSVKDGTPWPPGPTYALWHRFLVSAGVLPGQIFSNYTGAKGNIFKCPSKTKITIRQNHESDYSPNQYISDAQGKELYEGTNWFSLRKMIKPSRLYLTGENQAHYDTIWCGTGWMPGASMLKPGRWGIDWWSESYGYEAHGDRTNMLYGDLHVKCLPGMEPHLANDAPNSWTSPSVAPWRNQ